MRRLLNYTKHNVHPSHLPPIMTNLRLMLWAGDGIHDGVSDVARLRGYDVFLCMGMPLGLQQNITDLSASQTLCVINIHDNVQMTEFRKEFRGAFAHIDSDYYGNTPQLRISDYATLLGPGGTARHIEGINTLVMPVDNMLSTLEAFAPVLDYEARQKRLWSEGVIKLAKRDELSPAELWSSGDLKHPFYDYIREEQERFAGWQTSRNPQWPAMKSTLREQLEILGVDVITTPLSHPIEQQHLEEFSRFLTEKIQSTLQIKTNFTLVQSAMDEATYGKDLAGVIRVKQAVMKMLTTDIPPNMTGMIGRILDDRYPTNPTEFGLTLVRSL
jgi:hypothetical protein